MSLSTPKRKIIAIVGPTASGKSDLAIAVAKKFSGEIISADSRQVFKGMDIGTGKITKREQRQAKHYLLDIVSPKTEYTVSHFVHDAQKLLQDITHRNKIPIICGGTGFWIDTLLFDLPLANVKPDKKLRAQLAKLSTAHLYRKLQKLDSRRAKIIDTHNPVRLIRAIEIATHGTLPRLPRVRHSPYDTLWIGIQPNKKILQKRIHDRLHKRIRAGMIAEIKKLHASGVSWKRLESFGLEYRNVSFFLQKKVSKRAMIEKLETEIRKYAKRQMTWFARNKKINWITTSSQAIRLIKNSGIK